MPEYLTKEEVRQWRSSLERITLEEYAARLGKVVQGEKHTNDMIDKVMTHSLNSMQTSDYHIKSEKITTLSIKHTEKEPVKIKKEVQVQPKKQPEKQVKPEVNEIKTPIKEVKSETKKVVVTAEVSVASSEITFKKPLIPREKMIFDYLLQNKNVIVYAKDMANLLELPRDYVYKYIKNLRQKLNEDVLYNADNGGYVLKIQK